MKLKTKRDVGDIVYILNEWEVYKFAIKEIEIDITVNWIEEYYVWEVHLPIGLTATETEEYETGEVFSSVEEAMEAVELANKKEKEDFDNKLKEEFAEFKSLRIAQNKFQENLIAKLLGK